jgi:hypothetical protein
MSSTDDPEERIRQLEQQSANYGARELGTTEYSSAPPPPIPPPPTAPLPPPVYGPYQGDPYQPPFGTQYNPVRKQGVPVGLITLLVVVLSLVVLGGIAAIVWSMMAKTDEIVSSFPSFSQVPEDGSFDAPTIPSVPVIPIPSMPSMPDFDAPPTGVPGQPLSIAGVDKNQTVACNDAIVSVSGVNNTVELTGHCRSVTVSGVNNRVTIEATDEIGASGFDNQVTYLTGDPKIDATQSNTVQRR